MNKFVNYILVLNLCLMSVAFAATDSFVAGTTTGTAGTLNLVTGYASPGTGVQTGVQLKTTGSSGTPKNYKITVTSQNGGLKNTTAISKGASASSALLSYSLNWVNVSNTMTSAGPVSINNTSKQTIATVTDNGSFGGGGFKGDVNFIRTGTSAANMYSGTYTDIVTIAAEQASTIGSATFTLTASVSDTIVLTVTPTSSASNLPLSQTQTQLSLGTVSITANCQNGYLLKVSSANAGRLINTAAGANPLNNEKIDYNLFYSGTQVSTTVTPVTVMTNNSATLLSTSTQIGSVGISYTGITPSAMRAGSYQDNLTFTLQSQ